MLGFIHSMDDVVDTPVPEQPQPESLQPLLPTEPVPPIESRFLFVDVAALRAKQLRRGARLRILTEDGPLPRKAERLAMEEVKRGLVMYDVPPPKSRESKEAENA
jgi:DNA-directed RNA polymerase subunit K/omega